MNRFIVIDEKMYYEFGGDDEEEYTEKAKNKTPIISSKIYSEILTSGGKLPELKSNRMINYSYLERRRYELESLIR